MLALATAFGVLVREVCDVCFITQTDTQILCIVYLWTEDDVIAETREAMLEMMLDISIAIPLSAYARTDGHYVFIRFAIDSF